MTFPKMSFATFALAGAWVAIGLLVAAYAALFIAAYLLHPSAVMFVVALGAYYLAVMLGQEVRVARQMAALEEYRKMMESEQVPGAPGLQGGSGDGGLRFDPSSIISGARGRMH